VRRVSSQHVLCLYPLSRCCHLFGANLASLATFATVSEYHGPPKVKRGPRIVVTTAGGQVLASSYRSLSHACKHEAFRKLKKIHRICVIKRAKCPTKSFRKTMCRLRSVLVLKNLYIYSVIDFRLFLGFAKPRNNRKCKRAQTTSCSPLFMTRDN
jgi:hypothetical protein